MIAHGIRCRGKRAGVTLLELLLVLAVIAVAIGVVSVSFKAPASVDGADSITAKLEGLRIQAVRSGQPTTEKFRTPAGIGAVTAYPDSRVIGDPTLLLDPLNGRPRVDR